MGWWGSLPHVILLTLYTLDILPSIPLSFTQCTQYNFWWYELILLESIQTYPDCLFMFCIYLVEIFVPGEFWSYQIPSNMMCEFIWSASWYTWILIWWSYAFTHLLTLSYDVDLAFRFYVNPKNCANTNTNSITGISSSRCVQIYTFSTTQIST